MKEKYVQLPPLPLDLPLESIEIIWTYAKMPQQERELFQKFMRETLDGNKEDIYQAEQAKAVNYNDIETNPDVTEFISLMQEMVGTLIAQACEMAALVLQYYCIDEKSIKEISEAVHVPEKTIELMAQYYERKMK